MLNISEVFLDLEKRNEYEKKVLQMIPHFKNVDDTNAREAASVRGIFG